MTINDLFLPLDVYERHKKVANYINDNQTVLDVGGGLKSLSKFTKAKITVSNVDSGDIIADARNLPVKNGSYDVVTSIDVLEHIKKSDRQKFIDELFRVSKKRTIISAPFGSKEHIASEKELYIMLQKQKREVKYLTEHITIGLPTEAEVQTYLKGKRFKILYSGDFRLMAFLLKIHNSEFKNPKLNKLFYYFKLLINLMLNLVYCPFSFGKKHKFTNRFYLIIDK